MENEHFYSVTDKLTQTLNTQNGMALNVSTSDFEAAAGGYVYVFTVHRALFMTGEMEDTFGILPYPKYDEEQMDYQTTMVHHR